MTKISILGQEMYLQTVPTLPGWKSLVIKKVPKGKPSNAQRTARARLGVTSAELAASKYRGTQRYGNKVISKHAAALASKFATSGWVGEGKAGGKGKEARLAEARNANAARVAKLRMDLGLPVTPTTYAEAYFP